MNEEEFAAWPKCAVEPCQNKCCLRLRSKFCWPHTKGALGPEDMEVLRDEVAEDELMFKEVE